MSIKQNNSNILMGFLAFSVAFPIIVVCSAWLLPGTELWGHFSENLLPELISFYFNIASRCWHWS